MKKTPTITTQGFLFLKEYPAFWIFPILLLTIHLLVFYLLIYLTELAYGINVFSSSSMEEWISLIFWDKLSHIIEAVVLLYIFSAVLILINTIATKEISLKLQNKKHDVKISLKLTFSRFPSIIKYSAITSINLFLSFLKIASIKDHLEYFKKKLAKEKIDNKPKMLSLQDYNKYLILIPNIISNKKNLKYNMDLSKKLIVEKLGTNAYLKPFYMKINIEMITSLILIFFIVKYFSSVLSGIIITVTLFFIFNNLIKFPFFIFIAALYNYTTGKTTGKFYSSEFIKNQFENVN